MIQYKYLEGSPFALLVYAVNLPLNILCPLKALKLKQSMLENMIIYSR